MTTNSPEPEHIGYPQHADGNLAQTILKTTIPDVAHKELLAFHSEEIIIDSTLPTFRGQLPHLLRATIAVVSSRRPATATILADP